MRCPAWAWTIRIAFGIVSCALLFQSWRITQADLLSSSTKPGDLDRAIAIEPENETYRLRKASADLAEGVPSARTEAELREVLKQNPKNAQAIMALGLLAESRGELTEAERLLEQAAEFDLTFKPAWSLINFYLRTNQQEKMWPEIRKALDVTTKPDMLYFDVQSIFDLCWGANADPKKILSVMPPHPQAWLSYFVYLVRQNHLDAAAEVYPKALRFMNSANPFYNGIATDFSNLLFQVHRVDQAVEVWNQLVQKGLLESTELHPDRAESIADPEFRFPVDRSPFGWFISHNTDVATTFTPQSIVVEFSGKQPEVSAVLIKNLPVIPDRDYFLTWTADGSRIIRPTDPKEMGLNIRFFDGDRPLPTTCSAFLSREKDRGCSLHVPAGMQGLNMRLMAERQQGSIRVRGTLQISRFHLAFADHPIS